MAMLPSPPFVAVEGVCNFRDIGGYPITGFNFNYVKRGFVYRSAVLCDITNDGIKTIVLALGIRVIFDLRSHIELVHIPMQFIPRVVTIHAPVFSARETTQDKTAERYHRFMSGDSTEAAFVVAYAEILTSGAGAYRQVFEHVRDKPKQPFLIHCAGGKDRTGVLVALMFRIAGVSDLNVVGKEYELTEAAYPLEYRREFMEAMLRNQTWWYQVELERTFSARKENIQASMRWLDYQYGGIEGYFKDALKFQDEDIRKIKKNLVARAKFRKT
jgi:protein-tyrosine phosphatase family protein